MFTFHDKIKEIRIDSKSTQMTIYLICGDVVEIRGRKTVRVINELLNGK